MKYHLSNRQQKELLTRGQQIVLLLPAPLYDEEPRNFALETLPRKFHPLIVAAEWHEVAVDPNASGEGMVGLIGHILTDEEASRKWHIVVSVCRVVLRPDDYRGDMPRDQWPGEVEFAGQVFPRKEQNATKNG